jgi:TetR/AcrR family transcriptional repressor of uid operon
MARMTDTAAPLDATSPGESTQERLVAAAAEVFAEKGYEGAGVQEIARRAGLTTGAIYSRYSGKAELLAEAIRDESRPQLDLLLAGGDMPLSATELIRQAGTSLVTRDHSTHKQGLLFEAFVAARRDPDVAQVMRDHLLSARATFTRVIAYGQERGDIDPDIDTEALVHFCQAVAFGFLVTEAIDAPQPGIDQWDHLIHRVVDAMEPEEPSGSTDT